MIFISYRFASLPTECERGGGVNMSTDVLYSVNLYILFCVKRFELSHAMDIAL